MSVQLRDAGGNEFSSLHVVASRRPYLKGKFNGDVKGKAGFANVFDREGDGTVLAYRTATLAAKTYKSALEIMVLNFWYIGSKLETVN